MFSFWPLLELRDETCVLLYVSMPSPYRKQNEKYKQLNKKRFSLEVKREENVNVLIGTMLARTVPPNRRSRFNSLYRHFKLQISLKKKKNFCYLRNFVNHPHS